MAFEARGVACLRGERLVFEALDFALAPGGALLVEGPNGSGKSSLLRLCAGLLRPASGSLLWQGRDVSQDPEAHRARLQFVGHLDAVKAAFTVRENLAFWARLRGGGGVEAALERFGLDGLGAIPARLLSAGQRRRLGLARLLVAPVPLWLLDEPTNSLDRAATAALAEVVGEHRAGGGMVLAASHLDLGLGQASRLALAGAP